jgi:arylsulfatase A-like enzyme
MFGDHAIYHDGWIASTKVMRAPWDTGKIVKENPADYPWELYDLTKDWTQSDNIVDKNPAKLKELEELFWKEAAKYQVLPLDNSVVARLISPKPA